MLAGIAIGFIANWILVFILFTRTFPWFPGFKITLKRKDEKGWKRV